MNILSASRLGRYTSLTGDQDKEAQPVIVTLLPDSLLAQYDYTPMYYHVVSISSQILGDPTEAAMKTLQEEIIEFLKQTKFDGFFLKGLLFAKPFQEGKLIAYGTLLRAKKK
jgi:hypothetical protein